MKNNRSKASESSTNTRALSTRLVNLKNEVNPVPRARVASPTPRPMRVSAQVFVTRKVRVVKSVPSTATNVTVTLGDLYTAMRDSAAVVRVNGTSAWNVTNSANSTNYVNLSFGDVTYSLAATGPFEDWGGGGHPPSVNVDLPNSLAKELTVASGGTGTVVLVSVTPSAAVTFTAPQTVVVDLYLNVKM